MSTDEDEIDRMAFDPDAKYESVLVLVFGKASAEGCVQYTLKSVGVPDLDEVIDLSSLVAGDRVGLPKEPNQWRVVRRIWKPDDETGRLIPYVELAPIVLRKRRNIRAVEVET